ncbi:ABC transporter substrate-binding protein [Herbaspirillum sp. GCM10030257]|uniref:ABC transporter substrate-binding protein n=1 Tax=Herbaspirillum sp. GCM10030257 TaxID=3273393 RepID=UPI0036235495
MKLQSGTHGVTTKRITKLRLWMAAAGIGASLALPVQAQETFKLGIVTFLSGPAAESFGVPAGNAAKILIEQFNKGSAPAPYNKKGFGGLTVETVVVDEAGGATKQVQELRNLYQRENVDAVIGYVGSGDCLAVAPAAEEMKKFLVLFDCGSPRIFEEGNYKYVFRTAAHGAMDNVALARYLKSRNIKVETMNLINQDYAWGQDSRTDFVAAMGQLYPNAKAAGDLLPKFGAGQYGTEISALARQPADIVYSSLWGGDLQAFVLQAAPRGLFKRSQLVLSAGDHVLPSLGDKMPDGTVLGARGAYGILAAKSPLNDWFWKTYQDVHGPAAVVQASYRMAQSLMGVKLAVEKAMAKNGGKKPTPEELAEALRGSEWDSPGGHIKMALANGQQAIQPIAIGRTKYDPAKKMVVATDIQHFKAECVNPPANMKSLDWIKAGFPGAKCDQ